MKAEISIALAACNAAYDKSSSRLAYDALLWSVGNNHAGTYDESVLTLVTALREVLEKGTPWPQHAALEALLDLHGSFEPDPETLACNADLASLVDQGIMALQPTIEAIEASTGPASQSAKELLEQIRGTAA